MLVQAHIGPGYHITQTVGDHAVGADSGLLGRLEDHDDRAGPVRPGGVQHRHGTERGGGVRVVAAGVHRRHLLAVRVELRMGRGVGHVGGLGDGQSVEVCPVEHGGSLPVTQDGGDAVPTDAVVTSQSLKRASSSAMRPAVHSSAPESSGRRWNSLYRLVSHSRSSAVSATISAGSTVTGTVSRFLPGSGAFLGRSRDAVVPTTLPRSLRR
jgi:hypothetical protein